MYGETYDRAFIKALAREVEEIRLSFIRKRIIQYRSQRNCREYLKKMGELHGPDETDVVVEKPEIPRPVRPPRKATIQRTPSKYGLRDCCVVGCGSYEAYIKRIKLIEKRYVYDGYCSDHRIKYIKLNKYEPDIQDRTPKNTS